MLVDGLASRFSQRAAVVSVPLAFLYQITASAAVLPAPCNVGAVVSALSALHQTSASVAVLSTPCNVGAVVSAPLRHQTTASTAGVPAPCSARAVPEAQPLWVGQLSVAQREAPMLVIFVSSCTGAMLPICSCCPRAPAMLRVCVSHPCGWAMFIFFLSFKTPF